MVTAKPEILLRLSDFFIFFATIHKNIIKGNLDKENKFILWMICVLIQCLPVYYLIPPAVPLQWYCAVVRPCCGRVRQLVSVRQRWHRMRLHTPYILWQRFPVVSLHRPFAAPSLAIWTWTPSGCRVPREQKASPARPADGCGHITTLWLQRFEYIQVHCEVQKSELKHAPPSSLPPSLQC